MNLYVLLHKTVIFVGAGASVESGLPSAQECIWDWKYKIFTSNNSSLARTYSNFRNENVRKNVQN